jgi:methyl-accepting chemotaxis protein
LIGDKFEDCWTDRGRLKRGDNMTGEEMERTIQFLIEHHANVSAEIDGLKEAQERTAANIDSLTGIVVDLAQSVSRLEEQAEINRQETRDAINKLLLGNEVTRSLAQDVARLSIEISQRVTTIEEKVR